LNYDSRRKNFSLQNPHSTTAYARHTITAARSGTEMRFPSPHRWNLTPERARAIQLQLREQVIRSGQLRNVRSVAGIDVGFEREGTIARAAVIVLRFPELVPIDGALAREPTRFPYIPGLLSFREAPVSLKALSKLRCTPDVLLCDAHGYAHPRRFGLASHLGVITRIPSIGVAKSLLVGEHAPAPQERGRWTALRHQGALIGAVLRTKPGVRPLYVSVGHLLGLRRAIMLVMACTGRYRLPETTRWAHRLASSPANESERMLRALRRR
jgi:deoxyribonuclease V